MQTLGKWLVRFLAVVGTLVVISIIAFVMILKRGPMPASALQHKPMILTLYLDQDFPDYIDHTSFGAMLQPDQLSLADLTEALEHAAKDPDVKAVILYANSAGMALATAQEVRAAIKRFQESGKRVYAHADTFGELTGGTLPYYLASVADEIWMQPMGSVMLTGLAMEIPFAKELLDKIDVQARFGKREEYKSMPDTLTDASLSAANRVANQELLDNLLQQVLGDIATDRGLSLESIQAYVNRMPISGDKEPLDAGLIDKVAYADEMEAKVKESAGKESQLVYFNDYWRHVHHQKASQHAAHKIAVIYGEGMIMNEPLSGSEFNDEPVFSGEYVKEAMDQVLESSNIKAVVFRVNSGGGSPVVSETIWRQIRRAQAAQIPVVASMGDMAASGGYWVLTHADKIVANPGTLTGSIGVFSGKMVLEGLMKKVGVNWEQVSTSNNAGMWSSTKDFTPEQWQKLQAMLDQTYQAFMNRVAEGRHLSPEHVHQISKGRVWSGEQALKFGLVDALGGMQTALHMAKQQAKLPETDSVDVVVYPRSIPFLQRLKIMFAGSTGGLQSLQRMIHMGRVYLGMGITGAPTVMTDPVVIR